MSKPKTKQQQAFDDINELLGYYEKETKGEIMASQIGYMMGWLSKLASTDYIIAQDLKARLHLARQKYSSSKDTSSPRRPRP